MRGRPSRATMGIVGFVATGLIATLGGITLAYPALASTSYTAISPVYLRKGPATTYAILGVLQPGQIVVATGAVADGWVPVTYQGAPAYVSARYVTVTGGATPTPSVTASATPTASPTVRPSTSASPTPTASATPTASPTPTPTTSTPAVKTKVATGDVNVRTGPTLTDSVVGVLRTGTSIAVTGVTSDRFLQVIYQGSLRWVSGRYLADPATPQPTVPVVAFQARTTETLALRTTPSKVAPSLMDIPVGSLIGLTGTHSASYSQAIWKGKTGWVLTGYLTVAQNAVGPAVPALPTATGQRYVTIEGAKVYDGAGADAVEIDSVPKATVLLITGRVSGTRSQIIYAGSLRWIATAVLSTTRPTVTVTPGTGSLGSISLDRTNVYVQSIVRAIRAEFPTIKTMYGWRSYSAYSSDHPGGRALDIMIPSWSTASGKATGDAIARYLQVNRAKFHVHYLIWRQRSWNVERSTDYSAWRWMSDRGGATANHYDHVHVSVYAP